MTVDGVIQVNPDSTGKKLAATQHTISAQTAYRQAVVIGAPDQLNMLAVNAFGQANMQIAGGSVQIRDAYDTIRTAYVSEEGRIRMGVDSLLFYDSVEGAFINANLWSQATTTMTIAQASNFITLNSANITTINTDARLESLKDHLFLGVFPIRAHFKMKFPVGAQANAVMEAGFGVASGRTAPTDGTFFRWNSDGVVYAVVNQGGTETVTSITAPSITNVHTFEILVQNRRATFTIDAGTPTTVAFSNAGAAAWSTARTPFFARVYTLGTIPAAAPRLDISEVNVDQVDVMWNKSWAEQISGGMARGLFDKPIAASQNDWIQTAQSANSAEPATATLSNTVASYSTMGGEFAIPATAGAATDFVLFSYPVPTALQMFITGLSISNCVLTGAAMGASATVFRWALAVNSTADSLATAESYPTTAAPRRIPLGMQSMLTTAAIGQAMTPTIDVNFNTPVIAEGGRVVQVILRIQTGIGTASAVLRGCIRFDGYFE